ncbi:hypothetical protein THAOC_33502, partial [Thalassiosira oceanica]
RRRRHLEGTGEAREAPRPVPGASPRTPPGRVAGLRKQHGVRGLQGHPDRGGLERALHRVQEAVGVQDGLPPGPTRQEAGLPAREPGQRDLLHVAGERVVRAQEGLRGRAQEGVGEGAEQEGREVRGRPLPGVLQGERGVHPDRGAAGRVRHREDVRTVVGKSFGSANCFLSKNLLYMSPC